MWDCILAAVCHCDCIMDFIAVESLNNGHVGDEHFVHCSEVVPSSEAEMYIHCIVCAFINGGTMCILMSALSLMV